MNIQVGRIAPEVRERQCGGWIAVSRGAAEIKIGVTAETEEGARTAFREALSRWERILNSADQSDRRCQ